jgi:hypothetical protein
MFCDDNELHFSYEQGSFWAADSFSLLKKNAPKGSYEISVTK